MLSEVGQCLVYLDCVMGGDESGQSSTLGTEFVRQCEEETGGQKRGVV